MTNKIKVLIWIILVIVGIAFVYDIFQFIEKRKVNSVSKKIEVKKKENIQLIESTKVEPIVYYGEIDFLNLDSSERKEYFISTLLPSILLKNNEIEYNRELINKLKNGDRLNKHEQNKIEELKLEYKTESLEYILKNYNIIPPHMVLGQAALESGWGTSRFFKEGNNLFGVWSFNPDEPRIPASEKRGDKVIYVKKYFSILNSLDDYYGNINKNSFYNSFREARELGEENLINYLEAYSEQGEEYVERLSSIIEYNNLKKYDNYKISYVFAENKEEI